MAIGRRLLLQAALGLSLLRAAAPGLAATPLTRDRHGRVMAAVNINGRGPFRFAIDTAANLSMISSELAGDLRLRAAADPAVLIRGSLGQQAGHTVGIESLSVDELSLGARSLGILPVAQLGDADGLLGADCLTDCTLDLQLREAQLRIYRSRDAAATAAAATTMAMTLGGSRVAATRHFDSLLALRTQLGRVAVQAILDTGAQRSIGNLALQRALGLRSPGDTHSEAVLTGIDGSRRAAHVIATPPLRLGTVSLLPTPILYTDLPAFEQWGFSRQPSLLLGMDLIGLLGRVLVDYHSTRVLIWP